LFGQFGFAIIAMICNANERLLKLFIFMVYAVFIMGGDAFKNQGKTPWKRLYHWWHSKEEVEQKRLKSFIPLTLYTIAVIYGVIYLSILNTVNRGKGMDAIKTWYGGDRSEIVNALQEEKEYLENSFQKMIRKRVSGGR
jgi:hypothetical protein